jgi:hypothetical protein
MVNAMDGADPIWPDLILFGVERDARDLASVDADRGQDPPVVDRGLTIQTVSTGEEACSPRSSPGYKRQGWRSALVIAIRIMTNSTECPILRTARFVKGHFDNHGSPNARTSPIFSTKRTAMPSFWSASRVSS